jgi:hypothetical protein
MNTKHAQCSRQAIAVRYHDGNNGHIVGNPNINISICPQHALCQITIYLKIINRRSPKCKIFN